MGIYEVILLLGYPVIIIRRKPSEIPWRLDRDLGRLLGEVEMNGLASYCSYPCRREGTLKKANDILKGYLWEEVSNGS